MSFEEFLIKRKIELPKELKSLTSTNSHYMDENGSIDLLRLQMNPNTNHVYCYNSFEEGMITIRAFNQLSHLLNDIYRKYKEFLVKTDPDGIWDSYTWEPDWNEPNWVIKRVNNNLVIQLTCDYYPLPFPTKELAQWSLNYHNSLWHEYFNLEPDLLHLETIKAVSEYPNIDIETYQKIFSEGVNSDISKAEKLKYAIEILEKYNTNNIGAGINNLKRDLQDTLNKLSKK
jgi:hypothetical protein